jgi:hypothetical protein
MHFESEDLPVLRCPMADGKPVVECVRLQYFRVAVVAAAASVTAVVVDQTSMALFAVTNGTLSSVFSSLRRFTNAYESGIGTVYDDRPVRDIPNRRMRYPTAIRTRFLSVIVRGHTVGTAGKTRAKR